MSKLISAHANYKYAEVSFVTTVDKIKGVCGGGVSSYPRGFSPHLTLIVIIYSIYNIQAMYNIIKYIHFSYKFI